MTVLAAIGATITAVWNFITFVAPTVAAVAGTLATVVSIRNRIINRAAAASAKTAADASETTSEGVEDMKRRMDGLLTALLRQDNLHTRVGRLEEFAADVEAERRTALHAAFHNPIFERESS